MHSNTRASTRAPFMGSIFRTWAPTLVASALAIAELISFSTPSAVAEQRYPDVIGAKATARGAGVYDFDVTVSSPYDTPQRYADAFRVRTGDGRVFGERVLLHDHKDEQPFTRELHGVRIPDGLATVTLEGRDKTFGWGGRTFELALPGR